jgi:hypothetical protein
MIFDRSHLGWSIESGEAYIDTVCSISSKNYIKKPKELERKKIISKMISK